MVDALPYLYGEGPQRGGSVVAIHVEVNETREH